MTVRYIGSGPYCYANSLAMVLGARAPEPSVIEVLTGSPFGATFIAGLPFFSPAGWDPDIGLDPAIAALGWACERTAGGDAGEAIGRLREASQTGPVLVGPIEFGLLRYIPGMGTPIGSDHFVVVIGVDDATVTLHDPHGHPYATLPVDTFVAAWRAETVPYPSTPFTMRAGFHRTRDVDVATALRRSLPDAVRWLEASADEPATTGVPSAVDTVERLAGLVTAGLDEHTYGHLVHFAVRVGARRLADASVWLGTIGHNNAAEIADMQARLLGAIQYDLVTGDLLATAAALRALAPTYNFGSRSPKSTRSYSMSFGRSESSGLWPAGPVAPAGPGAGRTGPPRARPERDLGGAGTGGRGRVPDADPRAAPAPPVLAGLRPDRTPDEVHLDA